jgi:putative mRNA 3-end processing factor
MTARGLHCPAGEFYIDPWKPVERAVITHAHSDHARWGMDRYLCSDESLRVMRVRVGSDARIDTVPFGEKTVINGVTVSLHPAGHILGSAQVRVEKDGFVAVVSGDYKTEPDATCTPFELVPCDLFVTESTFGLPIYRWCGEPELVAQIND